MPAKCFCALFLTTFLYCCAILTPLPAMPPQGPVITQEAAVRIAIKTCGGWRTAEEKFWHVRPGYQSWVAEYDGEQTYWSSDDAVHVKAIVDAPTGKLLNCVDLAPLIVTAH